jgi:hypothetical protein
MLALKPATLPHQLKTQRRHNSNANLQIALSCEPYKKLVISRLVWHVSVSHTKRTKEVAILLPATNPVSGAKPHSKANMYFVHKFKLPYYTDAQHILQVCHSNKPHLVMASS